MGTGIVPYAPIALEVPAGTDYVHIDLPGDIADGAASAGIADDLDSGRQCRPDLGHETAEECRWPHRGHRAENSPEVRWMRRLSPAGVPPGLV